MATIIFDIYPAISHYNATFLLAKHLSKENRVIYVCGGSYQKMIASCGFETYIVDIDTLILFEAKRRLSGIWSSIFSFSVLKRKRLLREMFRSYKQISELFHPDLILLDSHHFYKTVIYNDICNHIVRLQSMVSTYKYPYIAPVCYESLPSYTRKGILKSELLWKMYHLRYHVHQWILRLFYSSNNYFTNVTILANLSHYPLSKYIESNRYTVSRVELSGYTELIISPIVFDFPSIERNLLTFFSPAKENRDIHLFVPRYSALTERLQFLRVEGKVFVIYCSLGTLGDTDKKKVIRFFSKIRKVAFTDSSLFFVCSVGKMFLHNSLLPLPENMLILRQVPQFHLLQYCDLMITHGGMNSITECIYRQVPMLVYPLNRNWDQPGNAARVVFHKLGLKGNISKDSPITIYQKIKKICSSYLMYKENLQKMKQRMEETPDTLTPYINSIV
ncbi:glycosyltransferase family 1 protein [Parabacteroides acidifaciens]|uniref:Glycosyltransferase family 1 protein n=1 Tax=Parabacteroides acidifaciens TaxID=2290935 RepID=A0A3D8HDL5_9BACT|nr:glycosyltransferase [Parabacteroides acidifaciens]MBC8602225.1 glycosyltransferase family 1 protein [Parabacteroides acidifaciens]RDU49038.1 hypothetical protein DWU89_11205 [Parabacteroides acidifaciens]